MKILQSPARRRRPPVAPFQGTPPKIVAGRVLVTIAAKSGPAAPPALEAATNALLAAVRLLRLTKSAMYRRFEAAQKKYSITCVT